MQKATGDPIDEYVGGRIRMRRLILNMSQEKLGDAVGVTFQQLQKYEKGVNRVSASRLQRLCHVLQVPVSFFFEGAPRPETAPSQAPVQPALQYVTDFLTTKDGIALAQAFMKIKSLKLRRSIVDVVAALANEA